MKPQTPALFLCSFSILLVCMQMQSQELVWPQFRGINASGIAAENQDPPLQLSKDRNMIWATSLSLGNSSPCIWNDHIFLTGFQEEGKVLKMYCLNRADGEIRWQKEVVVEAFGNLHAQNTPACATPVTDGERVVFYFGCAGLACYDFDGNLLWERTMPVPESRYGMGTSPVISGDLVILNCFGFENDPHLSAYNKFDGTEVWKSSSSAEEGASSLREYSIPPDSYSTPVIYNDRIIIYRSADISAYDRRTGQQVWRFATGMPDAVSSPVIGNGVLYAAVYAAPGNTSFREQLPDFQTFLETYDKNHDSLIAVEEIKGLFISNDPDKGRAFGGGNMDQMFWFWDSGNDGFIDHMEWKAFEAFCEGFYQRHGLKAISLGGEGDISLDHFLWGNNDFVSSISCPLFYNGHVYMVRSGGTLSCFKAEDGTLLYREKLGAGGAYLASPVAVDGKIYCASHNGVVTVLQAGDTFKILASSDLDERISATPAIVDGKVYLRTAEALYAFAE